MGLSVKSGKPTVGIIGGTGGMGAWFSEIIQAFASEVFCVGRKTDLTPSEVAGRCDIVVISVPVSATVQVIQEIGPQVSKESLLMDLTSIKAAPLDAMLKYSEAEVIGVHPLFGPNASSDSDRRVAVCPGRGTRWMPWLSRALHDTGMKIVEVSPEKHDHIMGLVQGVNHFATLALALCISRSGVSMHDISNTSTQTFEDRVHRIQSMLGQSAGLFGSLIMDNDSADGFIRQYVDAARELADIAKAGDEAGFGKIIENLRAYFDDKR
ncbi:MAG: prephenate dehydrogenase/arogenate dehydrogenase family protein [Desulfatiglans sp.]|jgi:prephenate dehydrogenase|nr:prephenate dehydrogenase/arogenate dehydrogenase family protein [Thermodesulfobacteriota bacterium]MEE4353032.1 prephenate dehydrogenase/arogenate dehydrogenase family protein [Desulfatiglans sp.]